MFLLQLRSFVFSLGFTITFGALFSKTWRVYRIFTNKKLLKRVHVKIVLDISNQYLFLC